MQLTEITIKDLVNNGILKPGTELFLDNSDLKNYTCKITINGTLLVKYNSSIKEWPFPSGAAKSIINISTNGWIKWFLIDNNNKVFLSDIRLQFFTKTTSK